MPETLKRMSTVALARLTASARKVLANRSSSLHDIGKVLPPEQYTMLMSLAVLASELEEASTTRGASSQPNVSRPLLKLLREAQRTHPKFFRSPAVCDTIRQLRTSKKASPVAERTPVSLRRTIVTRIVATGVPSDRPTRMLSKLDIYFKATAEPVQFVLSPEDLAGLGLAALATLNFALENALSVNPRHAAEFAHPGVADALENIQPLLETLQSGLRKVRRPTRARAGEKRR
jgi:hypothetical protein